MIQPGDLHRYFKAQVIAAGRETRLLNGDVRYAKTGDGSWDYRISPDGDYFLAESAVHTHPWGVLLRLDEVEPLPADRGLWHPDAWEHWGWLCRSYEGSWRQAAGVPAEHRNLSDDCLYCYSCRKAMPAQPVPEGKPDAWI